MHICFELRRCSATFVFAGRHFAGIGKRLCVVWHNYIEYAQWNTLFSDDNQIFRQYLREGSGVISINLSDAANSPSFSNRMSLEADEESEWALRLFAGNDHANYICVRMFGRVCVSIDDWMAMENGALQLRSTNISIIQSAQTFKLFTTTQKWVYRLLISSVRLLV